MKTTTITWKTAVYRLLAVALLAGVLASVQNAGAINYTNTLTFSQSGISSTNGSAFIYIPGNPYAVGDMVQFNGTTTAANPFGTTANRYYVIYSSGDNIKVATTFNGAAVNAANNITGTGTARKHASWLTGSHWLGGTAPNDNTAYAGFTAAGGGTTPPGGVVVNGNVTVSGLGYVNTSGDLLILSGSSNNTSLYPLTFATADGSTPKITMTNSAAGVIFLGHNSQAGSLKINGTQGLIFNSGAGGAVTGSGTAATSTGPGKDTRVFNTVDWSGLGGTIEIERGQVSQQNGTSTLGFNRNLTVGNAQTVANNLLAGFDVNARDCTLDALNGNSLGRIYNGSGNSILKVGNNNGSGNFAGVIGKNFTGAVSSGNILFNKSGSGTQIISGLIAASAGSTVTVDGGTLILLGTNNYGGATTVNAGKLQVSSGQLTTGTITVASGATLDINVSGISQLQPATLTMNATANTLEFLNLASTTTAPLKPGTLNLNGTVTVNIVGGSLTPGNSYPLVNWTTITGAGGFVLGASAFTANLSTNGSTLVLNITAGTNTWTGTTDGNWDTTTANWTPSNYSDGGLAAFDDSASGTTAVTANQVVKPGSAVFNNTSKNYSVTSSGANYIGGAGSLAKGGSGTLTLDGPNAYSGGTTLTAGQLNINYGGSNATNSAIGSGTLTIAGGLLDNTSAGDVTLVPAIAQNWTGDFGYVGATRSLNLGSGAVTLAANRTVAVTNNTLTIGGVISDSGANFSLTKNGNGTLALAGANAFGGGLVLNAGAVKLGNATALGTGASQLNGGVLDLNGVSLANSNNINNSAFVLTNSSASAGAFAANSTVNADFTIGVGTGGISVARLIKSGGQNNVTKTGAGTLTFNGAGHNNLMSVTVNAGTAVFANTGGYTTDRGTTNNGGTIKLAAAGAGSGVNANLINDSQAFVINGGTVDLNGYNETVATVTGAGGTILNNGAAAATITVGADNLSDTFPGSFQNGTGTLGLAKTGSGTQTFTGSSTYSGATTVSAGTLQAGAANALSPNSAFTVAGTLDLNAFDNTIAGLSGSGVVDTVAGGTPTLVINGSGNFTGTIQNSAGTLSLVKTGTGMQALNGTVSYSGTTIVSNGTLVVGSSLGGAGAVTIYAPGVLNATNTSPSISGAMTLSGTNATLSLLDNGIGTLALNGGLSLNNSNVLKFDINGSSLDQIVVSGAFTQSGKAVININQLSAPSAGTYTLISGVSGVSAANFVLGNSLPGYTLSLSSDASNLYLDVTLTAPAIAWWHNRTGTAWNGGSGGSINWDTDQSSGIVTATFPAPATDVYFAANAASSYSTTLGTNFSIKSLTFNTANNVTIAGAHTLTLGGPITVNSGAGANTISAGSLALALDQNVNVTDSGTTLAISSPITGGFALNVNPSSGSGTLALSGSSTFTGNTTITAGTLALNNPTNTLPDSGAVIINNGNLSVGANTDTVGAITLASGIISGSSGVLTGSAYNMQNGTVAANLGGTAAMTVNGSMILSSNSTYSGGTTISSGSVQIGASNALGSGAVTINNSTTLDLNGQTIPNVINFSSAGTLRNDATADAAVTANANVFNNPTIDTTGGNITVARLVGNTTRTVIKTGDKTLTLNGAGHNNLIKLQVQGGTLICANTGGFSADRGFELDFGTVKLAGPGSGGAYPNANLINDGQSFQILSTPSTFDLNGWNETVGTVYGVSGAVIENSAAGTNSTLTVGGDNLISINSFSGTLQNGAGVLSIAKTGSGVQIFNGTSTYSGNTTINNGQLQVTASGASPNSTFVINTNGGLTFDTDTAFALGGLSGAGNISLLNLSSSPIALTVGGNNASTTYSGALLDGGAGATVVKVGTGTLTLAGTNNYSGLTTVSNGAVILSPNYNAGFDFTVKSGASFGPAGNPSANSSLVGTVTAESGSILLFSSLPTPSAAPITVNTLAPSSTVNISVTAVLTVGTYNLVNYTNLTGGGFGALALGTLPAGVGAYLNNNTAATPKVIQLVVTNVAPQAWSGAVNTNWDIAATANWKIAGSATNYHDFSATLFDDSVGSGFTLVNLTTNVQPSGLTVSNINKNFTFTTANGSGISGSASLTKNGAGTLTLLNVTNTFSGGATISAGSVVLSSATLGSGIITDNASLVFSNGTQLVTNVISGSGSVAKNGSGTLELSGANTFAGGLAIKSGTVQPANTGALGTGNVTLGDGVSANNASLWFPNQVANHTYTNPITVAAGGTGINNLQYVGNPDCHLTGGIVLSNAATFTITAGGALFVDNSIVSGPGNPTITVDGGGTTTKFLYLTADNTATLTSSFIVTNKGNLKSGHTNSLSAANTVAIDSTSWLDTGAKNLTIAGLNDFAGVGGSVANAGGGTFLTLGGSGSYAFSGSIVSIGGVVKAGAGTQTLSGANTYSGPTIVSNGTLVVSGSLDGGAVTVAGGNLTGTGLLKGATTVSGGTLSPGVGGIGVLTISNSLNLQGTLAVDINKTTGTNDVITGLTSVTYGGTLAVNNLSGTLTTSDSFKLFSAGSYTGAFAGITPAIPATGLIWNTNTLTTDGILRIASGMASNPTNITVAVSGAEIIVSWPADHTGWYLQVQTNSIGSGLGSNWFTLTNTSGASSYTNTFNPANGAVFYRLSNQP